jgi:hypothetical protein
MVSRLPYPHVMKQMLHGRRHFRHLVEVVLLAFFFFLFWDLALVLIFWIYALSIPAYYVGVRAFRRQTRAAVATGVDDSLPH